MRRLARLLVAALPLLPAAAGADEARVATGRALFAANCQECHGPTGEGGAGGDIRGMKQPEVARATRGFEQMPAFDLGEADLAAIVAYLAAN